MAVAELVEVYRADDWAIAVTVTETIAGVTSPFDLTGATITSRIGEAPGTNTPATVVVISAVAGTIELQVAGGATTNFAPGVYPCDVQVVKSAIKRTAVSFKVRVKADVTTG